MSIFDRLTGRDKIAALAQEVAALKAKAAQYPGWALGAAEAESWSMGDGSQYDSQIDLYGKVTGINSAIEIYSALCAATELSVYQVTGEDETDIPNHPFEMLLDDPNPLMSRFEFMQATFAFLRLVGNTFWWINPGTDKIPAEIWVMPPNQMTPIPDGKLFLSHYEYRPGNGNTYEIPVEQVCHFKAFNPGSLFIGMGKAQPLFMTAETDNNMKRYNANYFGKDNAKVPGMLAYSDSIAPNIWEQMKKDLRAQWGGVNRSGPLFAQNVGKGVNWLAMGATQDEMQFLQSLQNSKEEMFASIAPGLASILAINATEANAKTGKATLTDLAMWPSMVAIAQRITKSVLPLYGVNLRAKFEDIRVTDRALALQENDQYARFHTIGEVRKDKFQDDPLGDDRDNLLVAQVQPPAPVAPATDANPPASIPVSNWPVANPAAPATQSEHEPNSLQSDLSRWQTKALKRLKERGAAACPFESEAIQPSLCATISGGLEAAKSPDDVRRIFTNSATWRGYP